MSDKHKYSYDEFKISAEKYKNVEFEAALEHTSKSSSKSTKVRV
jgi:hypothetical protein